MVFRHEVAHRSGQSKRLTHSAVLTSANVHDKHALTRLLHGQERRVYGDSTYASQKALIHENAPNARDFTNQRTCRAGEVDEIARGKNLNKSKIRARVKHMFAVVKRLWDSREGTLPGAGEECQSRFRRAGVDQAHARCPAGRQMKAQSVIHSNPQHFASVSMNPATCSALP